MSLKRELEKTASRSNLNPAENEDDADSRQPPAKITRKCEKVAEMPPRCAICMEFCLECHEVLPCQHRYCLLCIALWMGACRDKGNPPTCPECRKTMDKVHHEENIDERLRNEIGEDSFEEMNKCRDAEMAASGGRMAAMQAVIIDKSQDLTEAREAEEMRQAHAIIIEDERNGQAMLGAVNIIAVYDAIEQPLIAIPDKYDDDNID